MKTKILYIFLLFIPIIANSQWLNKWEEVKVADRIQKSVFLDVYFLSTDRNLGWICGSESQVAFTKDGGDNWETVIIDTNELIKLESIHFTSPSIGYTSGTTYNNDSAGAIYKSIDSGRTWVDISPEIGELYYIWGCYFYNDSSGVAVASDGCITQFLLKTTDIGQSWTTKVY
ncbi:MAG: YCF48-related protein, partial [Candidatus Kapaibacterium sp.]